MHLAVAGDDAYGTSCAVRESGEVWCWGSGQAGLLGSETLIDFRATPGPVAGLSDVTHVAAGFNHACALRQGGRASCWGDNSDLQLGGDAIQTSAEPILVGLE